MEGWEDKIGVSCNGWDIRLKSRGDICSIFWRKLKDAHDNPNFQQGPIYSTEKIGRAEMDIIRRLIDRGATDEKILNLVKVERLTHYGDFT